MSRSIIFFILIIAVISNTAFTEDIVEVNHYDDNITVKHKACLAHFYIYIENDQIIKDAIMGFEIQTDSTLGFSVYSVDVEPSDRFENALPWSYTFSGNQDIDTVFISVEDYIPDEYPGVLPGGSQLAFRINLDLRDCYYQLWQNWGSTFIKISPLGNDSESEYWQWDYTRPANDSLGTMEFEMMPCGLITYLSIPENDILTAQHCDTIQFQFEAMNYCGFPDTMVQSYNLPFETYGAEINNDGLFTFYPNDPGTYTITVDGTDVMGIHGCYEFDVVLTNEGFFYNNMTQEILIRTPGSEFIYDFGLTSLDCDTAVVETINVLSSPRSEPVNPPEVEGGVVRWQTDPADMGLWEFEMVCQDEFGAVSESCLFSVEITDEYTCGNVNSDENVNISDAVYLINYVFSGGAEPNPPESGDVNCDLKTNVSDAVWIINYVFASGPAPCECR